MYRVIAYRHDCYDINSNVDVRFREKYKATRLVEELIKDPKRKVKLFVQVKRGSYLRGYRKFWEPLEIERDCA